MPSQDGPFVKYGDNYYSIPELGLKNVKARLPFIHYQAARMKSTTPEEFDQAIQRLNQRNDDTIQPLVSAIIAHLPQLPERSPTQLVHLLNLKEQICRCQEPVLSLRLLLQDEEIPDDAHDDVQTVLCMAEMMESGFVHFISNVEMEHLEATYGGLHTAEMDRHYRRCSLLFHPDKNQGRTEEQKKACERVFLCLQETYRAKKTPHKAALEANLCEKEGNKHFAKYREYRQVSDECERRVAQKGQLEEAIRSYKAGRDAADRHRDKLLQIRFRRYLAVCLFALKQYPEAELTVVVALRMMNKMFNTIHLNRHLLPAQMKEELQGLVNITKRIHQEEPQVRKPFTYLSADEQIAMEQDLLDRQQDLMLKKGLAQLSTIITMNDEILSNDRRGAAAHQLKGIANVIFGLASAGVGMVGTTGVIFSAGTAPVLAGGVVVGSTLAITPVGWAIAAGVLVGGLGVAIFGIVRGRKVIRDGKKLFREPEIRKALSERIIEAIEAHSHRRFSSFVEKLREPYDEDCPPLFPSKMRDIRIDPLVEFLKCRGFRVDGIVQLLLITADTLVVWEDPHDPSTAAMRRTNAIQLLNDIINCIKLTEMAKELDKDVRNSREKSLRFHYRKYTTLEGYDRAKMAEQYKGNEDMPFGARLMEMRFIAKINRAILYILENSSDGRSMAQNVLNEIQLRTYVETQHQFACDNIQHRLDALEDFMQSEDIISLNPMLTNTGEPAPPPRVTSCEIKAARSEELPEYTSARLLTRAAHEHSSGQGLASLELYIDAVKIWRRIHGRERNEENTIGIITCLYRLNKFDACKTFLDNQGETNMTPYLWNLWHARLFRKLNNDREALMYIRYALQETTTPEATQELKWIQAAESRRISIEKRRREDSRPAPYPSTEPPGQYNILSIDGGGIRGVIPTVLLSEIEKETNRPCSILFSAMGGTSVGGVCAGALSLPDGLNSTRPKYSAEFLLNYFIHQGQELFGSATGKIVGLISPTYRNRGRIAAFEDIFGQAQMQDTLVPLYITALKKSFLNETTIVSSYNHRKGWSIREAMMCTTAAPTFFQSIEVRGEHFVDGGVMLNHPAQRIYTECRNDSDLDHRKVHVLSLGTGTSIKQLDPHDQLGQGSLYWGLNLHRTLGAQEGDSVVTTISGHSNFRCQVFSDRELKMDDCSEGNMDNLLGLAYRYIDENKDINIPRMLGLDPDA
ncbi:patatin [Planoprotostelium fungivorum]|uniref:Patatin n=1 Tax=Planoprotostelium fungivorum TaxID=1890364 RepID=A0A2P6NDD4_9EUKA|nr:patatin [Planoprotostelium fungivorum]